jgi:hypothetical protein
MTADTEAESQERTQTEAFFEQCLDIDDVDRYASKVALRPASTSN